MSHRIFAAAAFAVLALAACKPAASPADPAPAEVEAAPAALTPAEQAAADAVWAGLEDRWLEVADKPADPVDALEWTEVHCNFLAGELGGEPEQDKAINARLEEIGCYHQREAGLAQRAAAGGDAARTARVEAFLTRHTA